MPLLSDKELLRDYAKNGSETAFAQVVHRHADLVYSAALRQLGTSDLAKDVAQTVFTDLARKAAQLSKTSAGTDSIVGWLFNSTRYAALNQLRSERRRLNRERNAVEFADASTDSELDWEQIAPLLDETMTELSAEDREALLLRFFQGRDFSAVGNELGVSADAAQKRVSRALEKLRDQFARRGIKASAVALGGGLTVNAVTGAPTGLAASLATTSLGAASSSTLTIVKFITMTKIKTALSLLAIAAVTTAVVVQKQKQSRLQEENQSLRSALDQAQANNGALSNRVSQLTSSVSPDAQMNELLRLRSEVGRLRQQTNQLAKLALDNKALAKAVGPSATEMEAEQKMVKAKMNDAKQTMLAFILLMSENSNQIPTNFDQLARVLPNVESIKTNYDLIYPGPLVIGAKGMIEQGDQVLAVKEKQPWMAEGKWFKTYGFADGAVQIHTEPDGNFDEFEKQHTYVAPPQ